MSDINEERKQQIAQYRWKKGEGSPNPGGRFKRQPISDELRVLLDTPVPPIIRRRFAMLRGAARLVIEEGQTFGEVISLRLLLKAMHGELSAIKLIADRTEGKAVASVHVVSARVDMEMESEMSTAYSRLVEMFKTDEPKQLPEDSLESMMDTEQSSTGPDSQNHSADTPEPQ